jgi:hypothetical protein
MSMRAGLLDNVYSAFKAVQLSPTGVSGYRPGLRGPSIMPGAFTGWERGNAIAVAELLEQALEWAYKRSSAA